MDPWTDQGATDEGQHMLTCGPCNGFPQFPATCNDHARECPSCGKPVRRPGPCRRCALDSWRTGR